MVDCEAHASTPLFTRPEKGDHDAWLRYSLSGYYKYSLCPDCGCIGIWETKTLRWVSSDTDEAKHVCGLAQEWNAIVNSSSVNVG